MGLKCYYCEKYVLIYYVSNVQEDYRKINKSFNNLKEINKFESQVGSDSSSFTRPFPFPHFLKSPEFYQFSRFLNFPISMADDFAKAVDDGLKLAKRLYYGKDRPSAPPKVPPSMEKSGSAEMYLPKSPMVYAVIVDPKIVDHPDIPSYQPHVHGRCDPPALIPLQMNGFELDVDCYLDTAFVRVSGSWRVHCVMGNKSCDCRIAIPMGEQVRFKIFTFSFQFFNFFFKMVMNKMKSFDSGNILFG